MTCKPDSEGSNSGLLTDSNLAEAGLGFKNEVHTAVATVFFNKFRRLKGPSVCSFLLSIEDFCRLPDISAEKLQAAPRIPNTIPAVKNFMEESLASIARFGVLQLMLFVLVVNISSYWWLISPL